MLYHADDVDPWMQDRSGMSVLHWASWSRSSSHQTFLCFPNRPGEPSCHSLKDVYGKSMLHYAVQRGNADLIAFFLAGPDAAAMSMPDFSGRTLLHYATESGRPDTINLMLERGIDLDTIDDQGRTVLHHAAMRGNLIAAQRLIAQGATHQLSYKDHSDQTPADLACQYASKAVVDYFETLGHSGVCSRKQDTCLTSETASQGRSADKMRWNIVALLLLTFAMLYWSTQASDGPAISVI
jgi:ankyrin repeat protein